MIDNFSLSMILEAALPSAALMIVGIAWISWTKRVDAIPAKVISMGVALIAPSLLIVAAYGFPNAPVPRDSLVFIAALPLLIYGGSFFVLLRPARIRTTKAVV